MGMAENGKIAYHLLPIREAYEWKPRITGDKAGYPDSCFQFVKRMNGNLIFSFRAMILTTSCFQFVKRMNGNHSGLVAFLRLRLRLRLASNS